MPKYYYRARNRKGEVVEGSIEADNLFLARKALVKQNLIVLGVDRFNLKIMFRMFSDAFEKFTTKITLEEKLVFMSQLETGISVGIPLLQMLNLLSEEAQNKTLRHALVSITTDITEGGTLHEAFAKHPAIFDPVAVGLIKTGEVTGKLESTLNRISTMIEQQAENDAKVKSALFYPKIVVVVLVVVIGVVVYFVIPKLKGFLNSLGSDLPPITQFVVSSSDFFIHYWYLIVAGAMAIRFGYEKYAATAKGKFQIDRLKLKLPIFGRVFLYLELNNLCVILELLLDSGIPLMDSLDTLKDSQKNELFKQALTHCQSEIAKGGSLSIALGSAPFFPGTFKSLLSIGEESGRLQPVLKRIGRYYQVQIDYSLNNLAKLLEPVLLAIIFAMVAVIALAVMLPIWKMNSALHH